MEIEPQNFQQPSSFEGYNPDQIKVKLKPTETPGWYYVEADAGEGITFKTVIKADTGEIVDHVEYLAPTGLGPRAKNIKQYLPEAVQSQWESEHEQFWSQSEHKRAKEATELAEERHDELLN